MYEYLRKTKSSATVMLLAWFLFVGASSAQAAADLFAHDDLVARDSESAVLAQRDRRVLARWRARSGFYKDARVIRQFNFAAVQGTEIVFHGFDGVKVNFHGSLTVNEDKSLSWQGEAKPHGRLGLVVDGQVVYGDVVTVTPSGRRTYLVATLPTQRFYVVAEVSPRPVSEDDAQGVPPRSGVERPGR